MADQLRRTPLYDLHIALGAKMVPFAGWEMPVQYPAGVMAEHNHTRAHAGLFDVSHMGQIVLPVDQAAALEALIPADILGLQPGRQRYGLLTNAQGGILDDLMIAHKGDRLLLVVNAGCAEADIAHLRAAGLPVQVVTDRALLALQGPEAEAALSRLVPGVSAMRFMDAADFDWQGKTVWITRSGYTGEDGFEISVPVALARAFADALLAVEGVAPIGLGARDSLRLEAGMPLYGHDMDAGVTPAAAALGWSIPKLRRVGGARAGGFPGADAILAGLAAPTVTRRGLRPDGRAPIREGVELFASENAVDPIGRVTSGGFGPTVGGPIAMATLPVSIPDGATVFAELRGRRVPATLVPLPFVQPSYKR